MDPDALVAGMADLIRRTVGPAVRLELLLRDGRARVLCDPSELESKVIVYKHLEHWHVSRGDEGTVRLEEEVVMNPGELLEPS